MIQKKLQEVAKRSVMSGVVIAGSGMILGSGLFPGIPSWAIKLSNVALVVGLVVFITSVGFLVRANLRTRSSRPH